MCLISSSEIQKRIIFKVHAPRHGLFLSSSNISAFCPAFPPPTHAGLPPDRHIAICSRQSFAGLIFYPSRTANTNFPLYVHQTPSLSRRSRHPPAPVFRRPYLLSVPDGKHKLLPCINNISFILLSRHRPTAQLRFCRQHRISLAKALSFSPSLLLPAAAFRSLFTSFYHKHLPADVSSLNSFKPQMPVSKTSPALRPTYVSSSAR